MNALGGIVVINDVGMLGLGSLLLQRYKALIRKYQAFSCADVLSSTDALSCSDDFFAVEPSRSIRE